MNINCNIIADSIADNTSTRITTFELEYPRFIHAEMMSHRCIVGDTKLSFDLPTAKSQSRTRIYHLTVKEFFDKWHKGGANRLPSRLKERDLSSIDPNTIYSAKELSILAGFKTPSNIRTDCRNGNLTVQNPNKSKSQDWLILGSDYLDFEYRPRDFPQGMRHRLEQMNLRCLDENNNTLSHTNITDIWEVGVKDTYTLTAGDLTITTTDDHLILTDRGWKELKDIQVGTDSIIHLSMGKLNPVNPVHLKKIKGRWVSSFNAKIRPKISEISEQQNNLCHTCKQPKKLEIHHIVPVHENPDLAFEESNVIAVCNHCHKHIHHKKQGWQSGNPLVGKPVLVDSIEYAGRQTVYDLSVSSEQHNFVANGIVIHNCFSRNCASSRAIPIESKINLILENTANPIHWGINQTGMQADNELNKSEIEIAEMKWNNARDSAIHHARELKDLNLHKQIVNRLLEPFEMIKVVVTATDLDNFFHLRRDYHAQPEIKKLADIMFAHYRNSKPFRLVEGEYHIPYIKRKYVDDKMIYYIDDSNAPLSLEQAIKISVSCCAQVSYRKHDFSIEKANKIHDMLIHADIIHASPFEHIATPIYSKDQDGVTCASVHSDDLFSGNFRNWVQYRQLIKNNVCLDYRG